MPSSDHTTIFSHSRATTFLVMLGLLSVALSASTARAAWSNATDCSTVTTCQSDTSVTGENAGATVCGNVGLDYIPSCNTTSCQNQGTGNYGYACTAPAASANNNANTGASTPYGADATNTGSTGAGAGITFPTNTGLPDPPGGVLEILSNFFGWLLAVFGILAVGAFIISGVQYLISAGDDDMIKTAKRNMTWSIVGVLVGLSGWVIMQAINNALNANPYF